MGEHNPILQTISDEKHLREACPLKLVKKIETEAVANENSDN